MTEEAVFVFAVRKYWRVVCVFFGIKNITTLAAAYVVIGNFVLCRADVENGLALRAASENFIHGDSSLHAASSVVFSTAFSTAFSAVRQTQSSWVRASAKVKCSV